MKKLLMICMIAMISISANAQEKDAIVGKWQNPSGEGRIEIYKQGNKFFGKLYWLKEPNENGKPKVDKNNPDASKRSRQIKDLVILNNFVYSGKNVWSDGEIYDPKTGKTYSCKMTLKNKDKLDIRGYIGISLLGRSETWTRVE